MKSYKEFINKKSKYIGVCDRIRKAGGEAFWQNMMKNKVKISQKEFLKNIDPKEILDDGESFTEWVSDKKTDPDFGFYKSDNNVYFIQHGGFEFVWEKE